MPLPSRSCGFVSFAALAVVLTVCPSVPHVVTAQPPSDPFASSIQPFLNQHCNGCHNSDKNAGGVSLDVYTNLGHAKKDRKAWEMVKEVMAAGTMPPKKKPQPSRAEKDAFLAAVENSVLKIDCTAPKDPGRVTLRRLNRAEYNATIRDLCGVSITPADNFPADDVGYGFDNIGDVLSVQPVLLEKYMAAADQILEAALPNLSRVESARQRFNPQQLQVVPRSSRTRERDPRNNREIVKITMTEEGATFIEKFNFEAAGEYSIRVRAWGSKVGPDAPEMVLRVGGKDVKTFTVTADPDKREVYEHKQRFPAGEQRVAVSLANPFTNKDEADPKKKSRQLGIEQLEIEGPLGGADRAVPESVARILPVRPQTPAESDSAAKQSLTAFARRAFRRPPTDTELARLMKLFALAESKGDPFMVAIRLPLKAILVSPHFLFRIEDDPKPPATARALNDYELATRLSYFLWSSMPDGELFDLAARGELTKPGVVKAQVLRMLKDPKARALTENFATQWLQLKELNVVSPDPARFPNWDEDLRKSMVREAEQVFEYVVKEDRSVLEFLDADYTFVNARLARHYGIPNVRGPEFRKVPVTDGRRGGVLTQAGLLTLTSNPTRTSPVKRGKWVYENILGLNAPPPAPDVPELPPVGQIKGTVRQQLELHRANPSCATCHAKLDPLGFGLENFDAIGAWRAEDNKVKVDASGVLPDGAKFDGPAELRKVLLGKADQFRRCLSEKMLTYALGRGMEHYDKCAVDEITTKLKGPGHDHFSALILAIVESDAFRMRAAKRSE
jgi:mono/diheme cytochrome c family protein